MIVTTAQWSQRFGEFEQFYWSSGPGIPSNRWSLDSLLCLFVSYEFMFRKYWLWATQDRAGWVTILCGLRSHSRAVRRTQGGRLPWTHPQGRDPQEDMVCSKLRRECLGHQSQLIIRFCINFVIVTMFFLVHYICFGFTLRSIAFHVLCQECQCAEACRTHTRT